VTILWNQTRRSKWLVGAHYNAREFPPYNALLRHGHRMARVRHRDDLPPVQQPTRDLIRELRAHGVAQRPMAALGAPTEATLAAADRLCANLALLPADTEAHFYDLRGESLFRDDPEPYLWGLSTPVLNFVERYMGLPVNYYGVSVKREIANGLVVGTRYFHRDPEDEHVVKIIVYLSDVDEGAGPFQCLNAGDSAEVMTSGRRQRFLEVPGMDVIERIVPRSDWVTCLGPRLTANIADTARCLHRASPPLTTDRYSITYSYLSRRPYLVHEEDVALQKLFLTHWSTRLDGHQIATLTPPTKYA
jgi:hypothetical protein